MELWSAPSFISLSQSLSPLIKRAFSSPPSGRSLDIIFGRRRRRFRKEDSVSEISLSISFIRVERTDISLIFSAASCLSFFRIPTSFDTLFLSSLRSWFSVRRERLLRSGKIAEVSQETGEVIIHQTPQDLKKDQIDGLFAVSFRQLIKYAWSKELIQGKELVSRSWVWSWIWRQASSPVNSISSWG